MDMTAMNQIVGDIDSFVWGPVMLCLLVGTGIYLTAYLNFRTWRNLPYAMKSMFSREARKTNRGSGDVSPFSALMTALAATIGTGNIVGVATAMFAGGPGALVWMWVSACFGLTTKFSECMLGFKFREVNAKGEMKGGPMFTMKNGFKNKRAGLCMGFIFAMFTVIASFGIGNMTQANSITTAVSATFGFSNEIIGAALTVLTLAVIVGGITSISRVSSLIVPGMAVFYIAAGLLCIALNFENVPHGLYLIFMMAFDPAAVEGGVVGTITVSVMNAVRFGVARGCFSNEAGLGSAAISAAASTTDDPARQGYVSMTGTFIDTIIVCTITGLTIASSGVLGTVGPDGKPLTGVALTMAAFPRISARRETGSFPSGSCSSPTPPFSAGNITAKRHGNISGAPIHTISSTVLRFPLSSMWGRHRHSTSYGTCRISPMRSWLFRTLSLCWFLPLSLKKKFFDLKRLSKKKRREEKQPCWKRMRKRSISEQCENISGIKKLPGIFIGL